MKAMLFAKLAAAGAAAMITSAGALPSDVTLNPPPHPDHPLITVIEAHPPQQPASVIRVVLWLRTNSEPKKFQIEVRLYEWHGVPVNKWLQVKPTQYLTKRELPAVGAGTAARSWDWSCDNGRYYATFQIDAISSTNLPFHATLYWPFKNWNAKPGTISYRRRNPYKPPSFRQSRKITSCPS